MRAVDTNVIIRYVTNDDARQGDRARRLIEGTDIFVPVSVLLETEWILRSVYDLKSQAVSETLRRFVRLPTVRLESPGRVHAALDWFDEGMDFADALHLASARHCDGLVTFDRDFIKIAARLGITTVAAP